MVHCIFGLSRSVWQERDAVEPKPNVGPDVRLSIPEGMTLIPMQIFKAYVAL